MITLTRFQVLTLLYLSAFDVASLFSGDPVEICCASSTQLKKIVFIVVF